MTTSQKPNTLFEAVRASLTHAAQYNPGDMMAPVACQPEIENRTLRSKANQSRA